MRSASGTARRASAPAERAGLSSVDDLGAAFGVHPRERGFHFGEALGRMLGVAWETDREEDRGRQEPGSLLYINAA